MLKEITCIMCPSGCDLEVETLEKEVLSVKGNACRKGEEYAWREVTAPVRNIASSILVKKGKYPLVSVRLDKPVPKDHIMSVMNEIKQTVCVAPVEIGTILISNVCETGSNVIATKHIERS